MKRSRPLSRLLLGYLVRTGLACAAAVVLWFGAILAVIETGFVLPAYSGSDAALRAMEILPEMSAEHFDASALPELCRWVVLDTADIKLPGVHNIENYMAAIAAVDGMVPDETIRAFARSFGGVEHRIELVRTRRGVRWYNDSIASSPSRTMAGLRAFPEKVILIAGGKDKGVSYAPLGPVINDHVKAMVLCGATAGAIRRAAQEAENFQNIPILEVEDYPAAVAAADRLARPGDVVILSPASTSFDRFKNFEERGRVFKDLVLALPE